MGIEWREDLAIGVREVDDQHRELFRRFGMLLEACQQGKGKEELTKLLHFLDDYVVSHFRAEEKLQRDSAYPQYAEHAEQHRQFVSQLATLKKELQGDGPSVHHVLQTNRMMIEWLIRHISGMDKAVGEHLRRR